MGELRTTFGAILAQIGGLCPAPSGAEMVATTIFVLLLRCKWCGNVFYICRSCYQGQKTCSGLCHRLRRREQCRQADLRYQQGPKGRLAHKLRQRVYVRRKNRLKKEKSNKEMTDQGIDILVNSATVTDMVSISIGISKGSSMKAQNWVKTDEGSPQCCICGRRGAPIEWLEER